MVFTLFTNNFLTEKKWFKIYLTQIQAMTWTEIKRGQGLLFEKIDFPKTKFWCTLYL